MKKAGKYAKKNKGNAKANMGPNNGVNEVKQVLGGDEIYSK